MVLQPTLQYGYLQNITSAGAAFCRRCPSRRDQEYEFSARLLLQHRIQRDIGLGTVVDVSYVGSKSRDLPRKTNLNAPGYGTTFTAAAQDPTKFAGE